MNTARKVKDNELTKKVTELEDKLTTMNHIRGELSKIQDLYSLLAENIIDVIFILDAETYEINYISPSIEHLRGYTPQEAKAIGIQGALTQDSSDYLTKVVPQRIERFKAGHMEIFVDELEQYHKDGHTIWTEVKAKYNYSKATGRIEVIGVTRDITKRKKAEQKNSILLEELKHALQEIKTLRGIIPICSHCKVIRNDKGSWIRLEQYIEDHSDAEFSHSVCDACMDKYYSEDD